MIVKMFTFAANLNKIESLHFATILKRLMVQFKYLSRWEAGPRIEFSILYSYIIFWNSDIWIKNDEIWANVILDQNFNFS